MKRRTCPRCGSQRIRHRKVYSVRPAGVEDIFECSACRRRGPTSARAPARRPPARNASWADLVGALRGDIGDVPAREAGPSYVDLRQLWERDAAGWEKVRVDDPYRWSEERLRLEGRLSRDRDARSRYLRHEPWAGIFDHHDDPFAEELRQRTLAAVEAWKTSVERSGWSASATEGAWSAYVHTAEALQEADEAYRAAQRQTERRRGRKNVARALAEPGPPVATGRGENDWWRE